MPPVRNDDVAVAMEVSLIRDLDPDGVRDLARRENTGFPEKDFGEGQQEKHEQLQTTTPS